MTHWDIKKMISKGQISTSKLYGGISDNNYRIQRMDTATIMSYWRSIYQLLVSGAKGMLPTGFGLSVWVSISMLR